MFLIEYAKGCFVDGNDLNHLSIKVGVITFGLKGAPESEYHVDRGHQDSFLNNLQAINDNANVERYYIDLIKNA